MMLRTRWQKVLIDLWRNRARTLIVALAIAVGVYAVGVVLNVREMVVREYSSDQEGARLASAILHTYPFDDDLAQRMVEIPGVAVAEGRNVVRARVLDASGTQERDLVLTSIPDFENMQVDAITPLEGARSPAKREVVLEHLALDYLGVAIGDTLLIEMDSGAEKALTVAGTAHDAQKLNPTITGAAAGYVTPETMGALGVGEQYTELRFRVVERPGDEAHINAVADRVEDQLERSGRLVLSRQVITESIADPFIDTIVLILSIFGILILLLSGFLVINAISALITQQIPQIGVMKLIGARRWQIMSLYMVTVLVYGAIAIVIGIPLAILTAQLLMKTLVAGILNVMSDSLAVPMLLVAAQAAVGLLLPLFAGLAPVIKGTGITTQKALNDVGMESGGFGQSWVERILGRLQRIVALRRPILLAIRNTLRHRGRLVQTLVVLVVGTALFISVLSLWASVNATLDSFMRYHQYDVSLTLERPYRLARVEQIARQVTGVAEVEGWSLGRATRLRSDGTESENFRVYAVPTDTSFMDPQVTDGQWLPAELRNAIVINSDVVDKEPDLQIGAEIVLDIDGRESVWYVAGIAPTESRGPMIYMAHDDWAYATRTPGQITHLQVRTTRHDAAFQTEMEQTLFQHFEDSGLDLAGTKTTSVLQQENQILFTIVVAFLVLMALLLAAVGGLGLTTTMSINVMERVREIGVLRAVGASNGSVRRIVLLEGMAIGVLSWVMGTLLSFPISRFMSEQLGLALIKVPLSYQYSTIAAIAWFFVLLVVAVVASLGPARNAVRLTIREVLAYE
ncbi:MAG: FtsX-like permease family protein [Anaerolineae bacterium]|jgi:putative ABC transport system permease protein